MEISNKKRNNIIKALKETGLASTSHGIPNIIRNERIFLKILWSICFLLSSVACAYLIIGFIGDYLSREVVTKIDIIPETPAVFPTISICNNNYFINDYSISFAKKILEKNGLLNPYNSSLSKMMSAPFLNLLLIYLVGSNSYNLNEQEQIMMGPSFNELFLSCMFNAKPCIESDFERYFNPINGNCYRFNVGKNSSLKTVARPGFLNGFQIELLMPEPNDIYSFASFYGAAILIHNSSVRPLYLEQIDLPVGKLSSVVIDRKIISKQQKPFSECTADLNSIDSFDSEYYRTIYNSGKAYQRTDCFDLCFQEQVIKNCKCQDLLTLKLSNLSVCADISSLICNLQQYQIFYSSSIDESCKSKCPLECETISFPYKIASLEYPTRIYSEILLNNSNIVNKLLNYNITNLNHETVKKNILSINIYYNELKYTHIKEVVKISEIDLISGIGGTLGLFIGISFLSLVEIIELIFQVFFIICQTSKENRIINDPSKF